MTILIFITGLILGSFLNVVICRLPDWHSIIRQRSHCPACKKVLKWHQLIPLLSFLLTLGRCRACGKYISIQYPLVELSTALLLLALYWHFGNSLNFYLSGLLALFLIVIFVYDLLHSEIPDEIVYLAIVLALVGGLLSTHYSLLTVFYGLLIGAGGLAILSVSSKEKWMGYGDIKLGAVLGLGLAWPKVLVALFVAFILGSLIGLVLVAQGKKTLKDSIPFGPFLIVGFYLALFFGEEILGWYLVGL